jgi:hypothetical protein
MQIDDAARVSQPAARVVAQPASLWWKRHAPPDQPDDVPARVFRFRPVSVVLQREGSRKAPMTGAGSGPLDCRITSGRGVHMSAGSYSLRRLCEMMLVAALLLALAFVAQADERPARHLESPDTPPSPAEVDRLLGGSSQDGGAAAAPAIVFGKGIVVPFRFEGGHILVEASVDDHPPRPFWFDSGGRNTVMPDVARALDLHFDDKNENLQGIGNHRPAARIAHVKRITLGSAVIEDQKVFVVELSNALVDRGSRPRADGLIGSELLHKYVLRIDYRNAQLTMVPAGQFQPPTDGFALPLRFGVSKDGLFQADIEATLEHVAGQFIVDTGSGGQILLAPGFDQDHGLLDHYAKVISIMTPGGIGGRQRMRMGLGASFALGTVNFSAPLVSVMDRSAPAEYYVSGSGPHTGDFREMPRPKALSEQAGLIGNGVLAHFIVTLDYKGGRIYFEAPNAMQLTQVVAGTGLIVDKPEHESFEIIDILPGTAAERAGLRRGDRIVEVDGHPARDLSLGDFGALNGVLAGKTMAITTADGHRAELAITQILP